MIDVTQFQQKLIWLQEWMSLVIDRMPYYKNHVIITERDWVDRNDLILDIRDFDGYVRHKTRQYKNGWLRSKYNT